MGISCFIYSAQHPYSLSIPQVCKCTCEFSIKKQFKYGGKVTQKQQKLRKHKRATVGNIGRNYDFEHRYHKMSKLIAMKNDNLTDDIKVNLKDQNVNKTRKYLRKLL